MTKAERNESRTAGNRGGETIEPYSTDVPDAPNGSPGEPEDVDDAGDGAVATRSIDIDARSALPLCIALAALLVTVWFVRSIPRTLTSVAIAVLLALALNPIVEAVQRRTRWSRGPAVAAVLANFALAIALLLVLVVPPTFRQVRNFDDQVPKVVKNLDDVPFFGDDLRKANASEKVQKWLDELPQRLSVNEKPLAHAANTLADGIGTFFITLLLAVTLLLDGELFVNGVRSLVPQRRKPQADRLGRLVYDVLGKYIAGSLLVAALAGTVMLAASLVIGVPLAPLVGVWVAMTNPIPQLGGALGGAVFVALGLTQGVGIGVICLAFFLAYQQLENHVVQPLIVGRAVHLSPPATMVAALVGVSAGGVVGALFAVPLLGAAKAVYLSTRRPATAAAGAPAPG
jgi:predicted PurR-regulated permease PerM